MEELAGQALTKNIWELEQTIKSGKGTARARQMLLRAMSEQVAMFEDALGIDEPDRALILVNEQSRDGVMVVHGASGSPRDMRDLAEFIHGGGLNVYSVRLPGHGVDEGGRETAENWESCLYEFEQRFGQFSQCCKNVTVIGVGFGATLAMQMSTDPRPSALVLLAPAIYPRLGAIQRFLLNVGLERFAWVRRWMGWQAELLETMAAARKNKWWYGIPVFAAMCKDDERLDVRGLSFLRARLTHHRTVVREYDTGGHEIHRGARADEIHREVLEFVQANRST